jgi:DNA polymerase-1
VIKDWDLYWQYNAKDALYLLPIMDKLQGELEQFEATDAMTYSMDLHKPLMEMEFNGILTDRDGIISMKKKLERKIRAMTHGLHKIAGIPLNINSPKQMVAYFYGTLGIKPYVNRSTGNATCDAVSLSRIARKKKGNVEAQLIMKIRKYHKLLSTYFNIPLDADNRLRCSHKITGTVSGRIATEKTFFGTGANLQNQPYAFKKYLMADPGKLLCEVDLAKAEAHVVAYLCQDAHMMEAFISKVDVHTFNASKIFDKPMEQITKAERSLGKRVVHASNYGMGPQTFSDNLAKDHTFLSVSECKSLLVAYSARFPGLHRWHKEIETEVSRTRQLRNLFGRKKRFLGVMNSALFRNAYSYIPQSTVAELLNRGTIKIANDPRFAPGNPFEIDLLTTVHDSDVFQFIIDQADLLLDILLAINEHMSHEFIVKGRRFTIGLDAKIGHTWAGPNVVEIPSFTQPAIDDALHALGV